ncbi:hypoxia up-regulated 1 [Strigomonas culicis]|uniref:Hypoxia up-regulated 1 n=1 Tax=Strigomonas culicis TaxID=28005 RepID=S9UBL2_9TRYP|nr:hypoxia up-regulated 1 [Strigomonas culicis]EPY29468.1 hypoxia up-regulated 1 [Strigomonas culicis]|eukprot:EPY26343.1 hypoxia up-regulated 1 [Strigomonas culicis]
MKALATFLLLAFAVCFCGVASGHVLGVDFGSEFIKIAAPHGDQVVDIVLNELSRRKTENFIGFRNGERYIGNEAKTLAARFPLKIASAINQLIGVQDKTEELKDFEQLLYEYKFGFSPRGTSQVLIDGVKEPYTTEELYAMMFTYFKHIAVNDDIIDPKSVVLTLPFHSTLSERRSILEAAHFSDTRVLAYMHSTTAAAFYYGVRRRGFEGRTVNLVIFDVGSTHSEIGVYTFSPPKNNSAFSEKLGTLSTRTVLVDKTLGGRAFDLCIARVMEKEAVEKMGIKPVIGGKTQAQLKSQYSLLRAANQVREILSVNSVTPFTVEGIAPDRDFDSHFSREQFEAECGHLFTRVTKLASDALAASGLSKSEIDAFEMMGGASRTPKIITDVSVFLGKDVDRTMNMDEAAAIGAAYYAVKISPHYRSKSFKVQERVPFPLYFSVYPAFHSNKPSARRMLLHSDAFIGDAVSITFNRTDDFTVRLYQSETTEEPFAEVRVEGVKKKLDVMNFFEPLIAHENNSHLVRLQLLINETGLPMVDASDVVYRYVTNVTERHSVTDAADEEDAHNESAPHVKYVYKLKTRKRELHVPATLHWFHPRELTEEEAAHIAERLFAVDEHERVKAERAHARNDLESFIFWAKREGILENTTIVKKTDAKLLGEFEQQLRDALEWLEDGDGSMDSCPTKEYKSLLSQLKEQASGIQKPLEPVPVPSENDAAATSEGEEDL